MIYSPNSSSLTFSNLLKLCLIVFPTTDTFNLPALALSVVINNLLSWSGFSAHGLGHLQESGKSSKSVPKFGERDLTRLRACSLSLSLRTPCNF